MARGFRVTFDQKLYRHDWDRGLTHLREQLPSMGMALMLLGLFLQLARWDRTIERWVPVLGLGFMAAGGWLARSHLTEWIKVVAIRRLMLVAGVFLIVVNILPSPLLGLGGAGWGYDWSSDSRFFLGFGAVLVALVVLTKRKDESF